MAIGTDAAIEFFGVQDTLGTSSAAVSDTAFSLGVDLSAWANDDDAPMASIILSANFSVAPTANSAIHLYAQLLDIQGTNDTQVPDANFRNIYMGSFLLNDVTIAQHIALDINLPNVETSQQYLFFIENQSGQSLPAGWDIFITPKTLGPHA